jgi:TatD DNase family protein
MLIDTHAHLNFNAYKEDLNEVIKRALDNNVWMINVGSQYTTSKKTVEIARRYEKGVYAAVGLHPIHLNTGLVKIKLDKEEVAFNSREEGFDYEEYKELAKNEKVVAIGEVGFDYYWKPKTKRKLELFKEKQKEVFLQQLKLAKEINLPVIFHCRMAHRDLIEFLLNNQEVKPEKAVAHAFVGNLEELKSYLDLGYFIGFNGIIFKKIEGISFEENIKNTPLKRILIETDCPYLTPPQVEGRNEPLYVKYIVEKIAEIKNISFEEIAKKTCENAKNLFKI